MTSSIAANPEAARERLIFALDVPDRETAAGYIRALSGRVGLFKLGLELFIREGRVIIDDIREQGGAGVFLDLKLHDIPATVFRAMSNIAVLGVDFTTVHCAGQADMLKAAVEAAAGRVRLLGVTVLTSVSAGDVRSAGFAEPFASDVGRLVLKRAGEAAHHGLAGVVCSAAEAPLIKQKCGAGFLAVTPGIRSEADRMVADDQQRVITPARAVRNGADYLVVGRPIRDAADPAAAAASICREMVAAGSDS
ncbi:MAG: orotidine-5'-phosphate decarboxylase [Desulfosudaceae bacterium]